VIAPSSRKNIKQELLIS
jgi:hypothetical protein